MQGTCAETKLIDDEKSDKTCTHSKEARTKTVYFVNNNDEEEIMIMMDRYRCAAAKQNLEIIFPRNIKKRALDEMANHTKSKYVILIQATITSGGSQFPCFNFFSLFRLQTKFKTTTLFPFCFSFF